MANVAIDKPAPDLFLLAADRLGIPSGDCTVLKDPPHGIAGAVAAGMRAVGFVGGSHHVGQQAADARVLRNAWAALVIDDLSLGYEALVPRQAGWTNVGTRGGGPMCRERECRQGTAGGRSSGLGRGARNVAQVDPSGPPVRCAESYLEGK